MSGPGSILYGQSHDGIWPMLGYSMSCGTEIGEVLAPYCATECPVDPRSVRYCSDAVEPTVPVRPEPVLPWTNVVTRALQYKPQLVRYWPNADPLTVPADQSWHGAGPFMDPKTGHIDFLIEAGVGTILQHQYKFSLCVPT